MEPSYPTLAATLNGDGNYRKEGGAMARREVGSGEGMSATSFACPLPGEAFVCEALASSAERTPTQQLVLRALSKAECDGDQAKVAFLQKFWRINDSNRLSRADSDADASSVEEHGGSDESRSARLSEVFSKCRVGRGMRSGQSASERRQH